MTAGDGRDRRRRAESEGLDGPTRADTPPPDAAPALAEPAQPVVPATPRRRRGSESDVARKIGSSADVSGQRTRTSSPAIGESTAPPSSPASDGGRLRATTRSMPRLATPSPAPELRLRMRTKLVAAMVFAALVPVGIVALLATSVILSSLEAGLREDADRQLTVGLNLVLRAVERLGDETVQLSESPDLAAALRGQAGAGSNELVQPPLDDRPQVRGPVGPAAPELEAWLAREASHVPSARLQLIDTAGRIVFERTLGGNDARFIDVGVVPGDPSYTAIATASSSAWARGVSLVTLGDRVVVRAMAPVVDTGLTLRGALVLSTPLDGDFADAIKGALSADVLVGGPSGTLAGTFRSSLGGRVEPIALDPDDRTAVLRSQRVVRDLDVATGSYKIAATALNNASKQPVGILGVAIDRAPLAATKTLAVRTLIAGGLAAVTFALVLALFWSRRLGAPIVRLHRGAIAVSRGDLDHRIDVAGADELADLATAFNQMTSTLKDNQARLAARMREIVALHDAGRAVSSVIDLDSVSRKIVDAVARTFDVQLAALWLADGKLSESGVPRLRASAARARRPDVSMALATDEALAAANALADIAEHVRTSRSPLRLVRAGDDPTYGEAARTAGAPGPLIALPLDRTRATAPSGGAARVVGVLAVGRAFGGAMSAAGKPGEAREFTEADLNLLTTFADQAGAAVENALLYSEVRDASEELEKKVRLRTAELTAINTELGRALADLREAQAQLVLSERMAGLGVLVAGVAHEINSPTAAIRGSIDGLAGGLARVSQRTAELVATASPGAFAALSAYLEAAGARFADRPLPTSLTSRKVARELVPALEAAGVPAADAPAVAAELADVGAGPTDIAPLVAALGEDRRLAITLARALTDHVYLLRTESTVRHAVGQIQRIVGALKSYSHLDQQATRVEADLHAGLETTLTLLHHALRDIVLERRFGDLPRVPVYVDELNQVWTNLISNAQQALSTRTPPGGTIAIETEVDDRDAVVRVIDDGPGVPPEVLPRIFEPFFTTKPKGEGTGLGLGIARQIVDKHGGVLRCESRPGRTVFEVRIPIELPDSRGSA